MTIIATLYWDKLVALGIPEKPLSSDIVVECLTKLGPKAVLLPPVILEELSLSDEGIRALSKLNMVAFGGGKLPLQGSAIGQFLVDALCKAISPKRQAIDSWRMAWLWKTSSPRQSEFVACRQYVCLDCL